MPCNFIRFLLFFLVPTSPTTMLCSASKSKRSSLANDGLRRNVYSRSRPGYTLPPTTFPLSAAFDLTQSLTPPAGHTKAGGSVMLAIATIPAPLLLLLLLPARATTLAVNDTGLLLPLRAPPPPLWLLLASSG